MKEPSPWTEARDAKLRAMWAEGMTTPRIAEVMGLTKNQVIGRAHRLKLAQRASPLKPRAEGKRTRPATPRVRKKAVKPSAPLRVVASPQPPSADRPVIVRRVTLLPPSLSMPIPPARCCQWPFGEPRTPGFRFCEATNVPGRSYCAKHQAKATVRRTVAEKTDAKVQAQNAYIAMGVAKTGRLQLEIRRTHADAA